MPPFSRPFDLTSFRGSSFAIAFLTGVFLLIPKSGLADKLQAVEADVRRNYPAVSHLGSDELVALARENSNVVLFDVREVDEFSVSHLPGAIRVDPGISGSEFVRQFGGLLQGQKTAVFYCSVGVRSSEMAMRAEQALSSQSSLNIHNLEGGIFRWHNEERGLASDGKATDYVHPYNWKWGRLVNRGDLRRYDIAD
jgi:rhodanese-related sulfurtransferase